MHSERFREPHPRPNLGSPLHSKLEGLTARYLEIKAVTRLTLCNLILSLAVGIASQGPSHAEENLHHPRAAAVEPKSDGWTFRPYTAASEYFRDAIASSPLPPVKLRVDPAASSLETAPSAYTPGSFSSHMKAIPLELTIMAGTIAAIGISGWHWGDANFHVKNEGWFGKTTNNGGTDKLGHAYSTFLIADLLADRIRANASDGRGAEISAAAVSFGLMAGVEILDGYTRKYGFSPEDLASNAAGAAFMLARAWIPGMREKVDFRLMYTQPYMERDGVSTSNLFIPPYRRSRYLLAFKASGFDVLKLSPIRFFEFHVGYDARGFHPQEKALDHPKERTFYAGIGLNVSELLFGAGYHPNLRAYRDTEPAWMVQKLTEYYQVPYSSVHFGSR